MVKNTKKISTKTSSKLKAKKNLKVSYRLVAVIALFALAGGFLVYRSFAAAGDNHAHYVLAQFDDDAKAIHAFQKTVHSGVNAEGLSNDGHKAYWIESPDGTTSNSAIYSKEVGTSSKVLEYDFAKQDTPLVNGALPYDESPTANSFGNAMDASDTHIFFGASSVGGGNRLYSTPIGYDGGTTSKKLIFDIGAQDFEGKEWGLAQVHVSPSGSRLAVVLNNETIVGPNDSWGAAIVVMDAYTGQNLKIIFKSLEEPISGTHSIGVYWVNNKELAYEVNEGNSSDSTKHTSTLKLVDTSLDSVQMKATERTIMSGPTYNSFPDSDPSAGFAVSSGNIYFARWVKKTDNFLTIFKLNIKDGSIQPYTNIEFGSGIDLSKPPKYTLDYNIYRKDHFILSLVLAKDKTFSSQNNAQPARIYKVNTVTNQKTPKKVDLIYNTDMKYDYYPLQIDY